MGELTVVALWVPGRPAPQGSKVRGPHGQMRESSRYLPAWRAAVKRATYEWYKREGVAPEELPYLRGPVRFGPACWWLLPEQLPQARIDGPPDVDKLMRSTWDGLTSARLWEDDGRVIGLDGPIVKELVPAVEVGGDGPGAWLTITGQRI